MREGNGFRVWYAAWAPRPDHTICVAHSREGIHWERERDGQPVEGLFPKRAYGPKVCWIDGRYLMFFAGSKPRETLLFAAISRDGFAWEMLGDGRAIIHPGAGSDFDVETTYHPAVLRIGRRLRV